MWARSILAGVRVTLWVRWRMLFNPTSSQQLLERFMSVQLGDAATQAAETSSNGATGSGEHEERTRLILLIRHGQTQFNVEGRLPGQLQGVTLTEQGRQQAHSAAVALAAMPLSAVYSSPLERAHETAAIIARGWALTVKDDPRLMDTDVGPWAGKTIQEISHQNPEWQAFVNNPAEPPDGIESFPSVQARATAVVDEILAGQSAGDIVAVVAHADVVKLIIARYTDIPIQAARFLSINNASISALAFRDHQPAQTLAVNWTSHPRWLVPPLETATNVSQTPGGGQESAPEASSDDSPSPERPSGSAAQ